MSPLGSGSASEKLDEVPGRQEEILEKEKVLKKNGHAKKVYSYRNSVLTDLMQVNHLQTVYNISVAVFMLLLLNAILYYVSAPQMLWRDINIILWSCSNHVLFVQMWLSFNMYAFAVFQGFKLWIRVRNTINTKLSDALFLVLYIASLSILFSATTLTILSNPIRIISNFAILCEQVRIFMKVYSFIAENCPRVLQYKPTKDGKQEKNIIPTAKHFWYFMFAPALIYRDAYPEKKERSFSFILHNLFKFLAVIFITYCIFTRFVVDVFRTTGIRPFTLPDAALTYAGATVVGSMMMFLMFYGMLHSWLNIFAELLGFGDREFYQDWWNSTSFSQYYRKWNTVVYDWLYTYIYVASHKMGVGRSTSMVLVFLTSALFHEYIIALSLGFFYPVLMVTYSTMGVGVTFVTKKRTGQFWNIFMWSMLFSGWGLIVCLYALEWYARVNCPRRHDSYLDFFIPRSWEESCHIIISS